MSRLFVSDATGKLNIRTLSEVLLAMTLVTGAYYLLHYVPQHLKAGEPVLALANYFLIYGPIEGAHQAAYVIPNSLPVWDTPAEIRLQVATLRYGEKVQSLGHFRDWAHVRTPNGQEGWISADGLMSAKTHEAEERLRDALSEIPVQALGHSDDIDNLHIEPSRRAPVIAQANSTQSLEIFGRRWVRRKHPSALPGFLPVHSNSSEVWYLVRQGPRIGWILGRHVELDIPKGISPYAAESNLVAWLTLKTVNDQGRKIPEYLVADRAGSETCDFTDIRVLTWWKSKQTYAVAYREKGLRGYFPILVTHRGSVPYFRLRLLDDKGTEGQKLYGLFDTITRVMGSSGSRQSSGRLESVATRPQLKTTKGHYATSNSPSIYDHLSG